MVVNEVLTGALVEINASDVGLGGAPDAALSSLALTYLNEIFDQWNATDRKLFAELFSSFTITPNLQPHTIGPSGATWTVTTSRPVDITNIQLVFNNASPAANLSLIKLNYQQWQNVIAPTTDSTTPTSFYYDQTWPNGSIYFWPVPTTAYGVQIQRRSLLAQVAQFDTFTLPPGYLAAIRLLVAKKLSQPLRKPWTQFQEQQLQDAMSVIAAPNLEMLYLATWDYGMPVSGSGSGRRQDFNVLNGQVVPGGG